jgi:hypothetical protein
VVIGIKSFYAATFRGAWSPFATSVYQFLDAFVQSWDTQLFPFIIWAGVNFRQLLPERLFAAATEQRHERRPPMSRAERRRRQRR